MNSRIRIFVSSPGDVGEERERARRVIERLAARYRGHVVIEGFFWEHEPVRATGDFQSQIPSPADFEIMVCILWSRLGTRLSMEFTRADGSRYDSGTEWEFEQAIESFRQSGQPDFLVYRKLADTQLSLNKLARAERDERIRQYELLDRFIQRWFVDQQEGSLRMAFHGFETAAQFEDRIAIHLKSLIENHLEKRPEALSASWTTGSPFRGLEAFEYQHASIFFGREQLVSMALERLREGFRQGSAFLLLVGLSGSGKSSLARAGLLPLLTEPGVLEGVGLCRWAVLRPAEQGGDPFVALAAALLAPHALPELLADRRTVADLARELRENPEGAEGLLRITLLLVAESTARAQNLAAVPATRLMLLVDQLEELLHPDLDDRSRAAFVRALARMVRSERIAVIATLRSDFYGALLCVEGFPELKRAGQQLDVLPPTLAELAVMVRRPAEAAGLAFERDRETGVALDDLILEDACEQPGALPLLQFLLAELWNRRRGNSLTIDAYRSVGRLAGSLASKAEALISSLGEDVRNRWDEVMTLAVGIAEADQGGARRRWARLALLTGNAPALQLVEALTRARLFVIAGRADGEAEFSIAHESLLSHWVRLREWVVVNLNDLRARDRFEKAARSWEERDRAADLLWSTPRLLEEVQQVMARHEDELTPVEAAFARASRRRARKMRRLRQAAFASLASFAAVSFMLYLERNDAFAGERAARDASDWSAYRALISNASLNIDRGRRSAAVAALQKCPQEHRSREWAALDAYLGQPEQERGSDWIPVDGGLGFAGDERLEVLTARGLCVLEPESEGRKQLLTPALQRRMLLACAPGGFPLVYASTREDVGVLVPGPRRAGWRLLDDSDVLEERARCKGVNPRVVRFTSTGKAVVVLLENGSLYCSSTDRAASTRLYPVDGRGGHLSAIAVARGESWVAGAEAGTASTTIHLWPLDATESTPEEVKTPPLSPAGALLLAIDAFDGVRVLAVACGNAVWVVRGMRQFGLAVPEPVTCTSLLARSGLLALGTSEGRVHVYDVESESRVCSFLAHDGAFTHIALSPDGLRVATARDGEAVRIWRLEDLAQRGLPAPAGPEPIEAKTLMVFHGPDSNPRAIAVPTSNRTTTEANLWAIEDGSVARIPFEQGCNGVARGIGGTILTWARKNPDTRIRVLDSDGRTTLERWLGGSASAVVQSRWDRLLYMVVDDELVCLALDRDTEHRSAPGPWASILAARRAGGALAIRTVGGVSSLFAWQPPAAPVELAEVGDRIAALDTDESGVVVAATSGGRVHAWRDMGFALRPLEPIDGTDANASGSVVSVDLLDESSRLLVHTSDGLSFWAVHDERFERLADVPGAFPSAETIAWDARGEWLVGIEQSKVRSQRLTRGAGRGQGADIRQRGAAIPERDAALSQGVSGTKDPR